MNKIFLIVPIFLFATSSLYSQSYADLNINQVIARVQAQGELFTDLTGGAYMFPAGSGKHANGWGALWVGGYDVSSNTLKVAAQTYRQTGTDYWSGPIDISANMDQVYADKWEKVWKINKTDLINFWSTTPHTVNNVPSSILDWPAKGNIYCKDAWNNALPINAALAPFIDVNNDGIYNPIDGDYPEMKGDQMLWWVYNDKKWHT